MQQYLEKKEELNSQHKTFFSRRDELSAHISRMDKECFRLNSQKEKQEEIKEIQEEKGDKDNADSSTK